MRTGMLRMAAGTGATAMLVAIGALATAGTASAATAPVSKATVVSPVGTHHHHENGDCRCWWAPVPMGHPPVWVCDEDDEGDVFIGGLINVII